MRIFLDIYEISQMLNLSPRTIMKFIREGTLISHRFGSEYRIKKEDLEAFIKACQGERP